MKKNLVSIAAALLAVITPLAAFAQAKFTTTGYFNGIKMTSAESGDYGGMSVYLTESDGTLYALVTEAAGSIMTPVLVKAAVTGKDMRGIEFTLRGDNGARKFTGTVTAAGLTLNSAGTRSVLKRECSETFSSIKMGSGGDYGGMEVYVTDAGGTWYALVTVAEGVMLAPKLVEASVTGKDFDKIAFSLAGDGSVRKFSGSRLESTMTLSENGERSILKRKCYK